MSDARRDSGRRSIGAQLRSSAPVLVAAYAAMGAIAIVAAIGARMLGRPLSNITHDPVAVAQEPFYIGALSNVGILIWWTAAAACLVAAVVLRTERRDLAVPLGAAGLLTAVLAADDVFLFHDVILPDKLGAPEPSIYLMYAAAGLAVGWISRHVLARSNWIILVLMLMFFACSIGIDEFTSEETEKEYTALEDLFKLFGIVSWGAYWVPLAIASLGPARDEPRV